MRRASGPSCRTQTGARASGSSLALDCERKVDRGHRIVPDAHFGAHKVCLRVQRTPQHRRFWRHRQRGKVFLGELDE